MSSEKLLSLLKVNTVPKDILKLLEEPISIIKGTETNEIQTLESLGLKKIHDLLQIENIDKVEQQLSPLTVDKLITTARIINALGQKKKENGKKVIVAGLDAAGKTTIIQTILDPLNYKPGDEKPTKGVNYEKLNLFGFKVNLWDLGGQPIYRDEYLAEKNADRHFGFTNLFIYVIDIQAPKRFKEAFEYLTRIANIYRHLDESPFCLILIHKSDPSLNPKDVQKRTEEISAEVKKILSGFVVALFNTSVFNRSSLFPAISKGFREISMVKPILEGILQTSQEKIGAKYIALYNKTGICAAEIGEGNDLLKNFTLNVILSEELGLFPHEASKLILALKNGEFALVERIETKSDQYYLAWYAGQNPDALIYPPLIREMEPWIVNFLH
ncbi:MAG: ADP-ribosylation factor-like protein [Candidatus Helarchaeota archaeon]